MDANKQKEILNNFILEFLPKRRNKSKYPTNEIDYVTEALEWICMKNFGFRPTDEDVLNSLKALGYELLEKKDDHWLKSEIKNGKKILSKYLYVDVSPSVVKKLRLITKTLPPNTNPEKIIEVLMLKQQIEKFKIKYMDY